jgi:hypothetical protein
MATNVRFLDSVSIGAFQATSTEGAAAKRFVLAGETLTIAATDQLVTYDLFNSGTIIIDQGEVILFGLRLVSTHALLAVNTTLNNNGIINVNGILEIGESNTFAGISVI